MAVRIDIEWEDFDQVKDAIQQMGACQVDWPEHVPVAAFDDVEVELRVAGKPLVFTGRVVHIQDGRVAVAPSRDMVEKVLAFLPPVRHKSDARREEPLWKRYDKLSMVEKVRLAKFGNTAERRRIFLDNNTMLHMNVLENIGITAAEVASLLRQSTITAGVIERVSKKAEWTNNGAVAEAIVRHPKTPPPLAVRMVAKLPMAVARRIAKQGRMRQNILRAARKRTNSR